LYDPLELEMIPVNSCVPLFPLVIPARHEVDFMQLGPKELGRLASSITEVTSIIKSSSDEMSDVTFATTFESTDELYSGATTTSFA
jgi:hypothetical protein